MSPRGPRVLVSGVVLGQPMGGVRRHNQELLPRAAELLAERGGELVVLAGRQPLALELSPAVRCLPSDVPPAPPLARARREARELERVLAEERRAGRPIDLVHTAHLPTPAGLSLPFTLTLHDLRHVEPGESSFPRRLLARRVLARALRDAARTITVSRTVAERVQALFGRPAPVVVRNGGDHLDVLPREPGPGAALLALGHLEPRKNLDLVLRALAEAPELPDLEIAGAPKGDARERLERAVRDLDLGARVRFLGPVPDGDLPRLYARAAAVVIPSRLEGFGLGVLEAQRAGVPLAIAAAGALPEVAGPLTPSFSPDDPLACARALRLALAQTPEDLAAQGANAASYRWSASARELVAAWDSALR